MAKPRDTRYDYQLKMEVRNADGIIVNLQASNRRLHSAVRALVKRSAGRIVSDVSKYAPIKTGRMRRTVRATFSPDGLAHQTGWFLEDYIAEGQPFYPVKVEPEQPSLFPAFMVEEPRFKSELSEILRQFGRKRG